MNISRLIEKYSTSYSLCVKGKGSYIDGDYIESEEKIEEKQGAILPLSARKIIQLGGNYTQKDKRLFSISPIDLTQEVTIIYNEKRFNIEEDMDFSSITDFYTYILRWVDQFDRPKTN